MFLCRYVYIIYLQHVNCVNYYSSKFSWIFYIFLLLVPELPKMGQFLVKIKLMNLPKEPIRNSDVCTCWRGQSKYRTRHSQSRCHTSTLFCVLEIFWSKTDCNILVQLVQIFEILKRHCHFIVFFELDQVRYYYKTTL